jgi:glutamate-1-semialdehyde 2,1-aminomutase
VLVFDEVISFRVGPGGMQERVGVRPDLTTLGKIIGGGYPLAAFGGRAEIMEQFDSRRRNALPHGGTFNGHPAAAAAGLATLRELTPAAYERLDALAARLADGVGRALAAAGVRGSVTSFASLFQIDLSSASDDPNDVFLGLLNEGHWIARRGFGAVSTPMTDADVDGFAEATGRVAAMLAR